MRVTPPPARFSVPASLALLLMLLAIPRAWAILVSVAPAHDAIRYWAAARCLQDLPLRFAIHWIDCQPLYPLTLSWMGLAWGDASPEWIWRASQIWSSVCHLTFIAAVFVAGSRWLPLHLVWLGCFAVGMLPRSIRYSVDVLPDNLHAGIWGLALLLVSLAFPSSLGETKSPRRAIWLGALGLATGVLAGLAYWVRIEGVLCAAVIALAWMSASYFHRGHLAWRSTLLFLIPFCSAAMLTIFGYVELRGHLGPRNTAQAMMGLGSREERTVLTPELAILTSGMTATEEPRTPIDAWMDSQGPNRPRQLLGAAGRTVWEWMQETRVWLALLSLVGLSAIRRYHRSPIMWLGLFSILACLALGFMVRWQAGYLAGRYLFPSMAGVAILAPLGLETILRHCQRLPIPRRISRQSQWLVGTAMVIVAILSSVSAWSKPLHRDHAGYRAAGQWLARNTRNTDRVFDPTWQTSFFAGRENWRPSDGERIAVRYAVVDPSLAARPPVGIARSLEDVARRGQLVAEFPKHASSQEVGIRIYEMPSSGLMGN